MKAQPKLKITDEADKVKDNHANEDAEIEEYYLGKDRVDERKRKAYVSFCNTESPLFYVKMLDQPTKIFCSARRSARRYAS